MHIYPIYPILSLFIPLALLPSFLSLTLSLPPSALFLSICPFNFTRQDNNSTLDVPHFKKLKTNVRIYKISFSFVCNSFFPLPLPRCALIRYIDFNTLNKLLTQINKEDVFIISRKIST